MPICALMSVPMTVILVVLMALSLESRALWNCSCFISPQGKYVDMRTSNIDLPLILLPRVSKELNLTLSWMNLPTNLLDESVVIGGGDPAIFHAS